MLAATLSARSSVFRALFLCFRRSAASTDLRRFAEAIVAAAEASPPAPDTVPVETLAETWLRRRRRRMWRLRRQWRLPR